ncbi:hypothetical protein [Endozoicomonas euniceicola]|uniref:Uncharacterized protein n=1 Tax=Endozoicomonas euniceicola TaxID=1234143 RepID=A0ABY6GW78_9GAMM|nr:hypothetical protein [Endozoicomonas euniceicola]UYM17013.1 hypothetical protein NX720_03545 [Endozoicomonas euniceicola]
MKVVKVANSKWEALTFLSNRRTQTNRGQFPPLFVQSAQSHVQHGLPD